MFRKETVIHAENGLHTRLLAQLVKEAESFDCELRLDVEGKQASVRSLFKLQELRLGQGVTVGVLGEGEGEEKAVEHLAEYIAAME